MIEYTKLFNLLKERGMEETELLRVISPPTLAKLTNNGRLTMKVIDSICLFLGVQPGDIMEVVPQRELTKEEERFREMDLLKESLNFMCTVEGKKELSDMYDLARGHLDSMYLLSLTILEAAEK